jgi:hypothetical protein
MSRIQVFQTLASAISDFVSVIRILDFEFVSSFGFRDSNLTAEEGML